MSAKPQKSWYQSETSRKIVALGVATLVYSIAEIFFSIAMSSLTLFSDGLHNLSDVLALVIAFWADRLSHRGKTDQLTYGWRRAELLGGLVNGVFLLSLCLIIVLDAIPAFIDPTRIENGLLFGYIAAAGFVKNFVGAFILKVEHGHHHGHNHSHENKGHSHSHKNEGARDHPSHAHAPGPAHEHEGHFSDLDLDEENGNLDVQSPNEIVEREPLVGHHHHDDESHQHGYGSEQAAHAHEHHHHHHENANMTAIFLHFLGDTLSSLFVCAAGLLSYFFPASDWVIYIDPTTSIIIVAIILLTTYPLVERCLRVLMQIAPDTASMPDITHRISRISGVASIHDVHVWELVDGLAVASVHCVIQIGADFDHIASQIKKVFHEHGIHSTTIQPEFLRASQDASGIQNTCIAQNCVTDCTKEWCCQETMMMQQPLGGVGVVQRVHEHSDHDEHDHDHDHEHHHHHHAHEHEHEHH